MWLGRLPSRGFRPNEDDGPSDGGGGGGRGPDDEPPDDGPRDGGVDWDVFEREFAAYVVRAERREPEPATD